MAIDASDVSFTQAGSGSVLRSVDAKLRELVSPQDKGAVANGVADDTAAIKAAGEMGAAIVPQGTYLSRNLFLERAALLFGNAALKQDTLDQSILLVGKQSDINSFVEDVKLLALNVGPMPNATNDNWAAINLNGAKGAIAALLNVRDVWTGIRNSYQLGGVRSRDSLILGCMIEAAKQFGIENLYPDYARILGNSIHNNGAAVGGHGIRIAGTNQGTLAVGNSIRDRLGPGISLQLGAYNAVIVGDYLENVVSGVQANATQTIDGRHVMVGLVIKNSQSKGVDLTWLSDCLVSVLVDGAVGVGVDTSTVAAEGKHRLDGITRNTGNSGCRVRSDKNLLTQLVDNAAGTPVYIGGNNNAGVALAADSSVTNAHHIGGNSNNLVLQEAGAGTVGLRVDGSYNVLQVQVENQTSINGSDNFITGVFKGNININAGAANNKLVGIALGAVNDNGTNTDLSGLRGAVRVGTLAGTTDTLGRIFVAHSCFKTPRFAQGVVRMSNGYFAKPISYSSTQVIFEVRDAATAGALVTSTSVTLDWEARV